MGGFLQASGDTIQRSGVSPTVEVDVPRVELGEPALPDDPILDRGLEYVKGDRRVAQLVRAPA